MREYLTGKVGLTPEEAELAMRDDDLWLLEPSMRFTLDGEEAVEQWERAVAFAQWLGWENPLLNGAQEHLVWDMERRAEEALRRARARLKESRERSERHVE